MNIYDMTYDDLVNYFKNINLKSYRAKQLYDWLYVKRINNFNDITNIKKEIIEKLDNDYYFGKIEIVKRESDLLVNKYLLKLEDGNTIDSPLGKR